jgi:chromosome segregation ATPase
MDYKRLCPRCSQEGKGAKRGHICICKALTEAHAAGAKEAEAELQAELQSCQDSYHEGVSEKRNLCAEMSDLRERFCALTAELSEERSRRVKVMGEMEMELAAAQEELESIQPDTDEHRTIADSIAGHRKWASATEKCERMCLEKAEKAESELASEKSKREAAESRCADWAGKWDDAHNAREKAEVSLADARKNEVHLCEQFDILREERNRMNTELQALAIDPNSRENLCQENAMLRNDLELAQKRVEALKVSRRYWQQKHSWQHASGIAMAIRAGEAEALVKEQDARIAELEKAVKVKQEESK